MEYIGVSAFLPETAKEESNPMQQSGRADVRTKVANLKPEFDELVFDLLEQLRTEEL